LRRARSARIYPRQATEGVRGLVRPVRLPQPMGAGGQQPLRSQPLPRGVDSTLRRPEEAEALTVKIRDIRSVWSATRIVGPAIREPTMYDRCHGGATCACGGSPRLKG